MANEKQEKKTPEIDVDAMVDNHVQKALKALEQFMDMTQEQVENLFAAAEHVPSRRGSGIGVRNVNERIKLYFGKEYGLVIDSEPDEGTTVTAHLPAVAYEQVAQKVT